VVSLISIENIRIRKTFALKNDGLQETNNAMDSAVNSFDGGIRLPRQLD